MVTFWCAYTSIQHLKEEEGKQEMQMGAQKCNRYHVCSVLRRVVFFIPVTADLIPILYLHNTCLKIKAFMIGKLSA